MGNRWEVSAEIGVASSAGASCDPLHANTYCCSPSHLERIQLYLVYLRYSELKLLLKTFVSKMFLVRTAVHCWRLHFPFLARCIEQILIRKLVWFWDDRLCEWTRDYGVTTTWLVTFFAPCWIGTCFLQYLTWGKTWLTHHMTSVQYKLGFVHALHDTYMDLNWRCYY